MLHDEEACHQKKRQPRPDPDVGELPELLHDLALAHPALAIEGAATRALIHHAISDDVPARTHSLKDEERQARLEDWAYWQPLKQESECPRRR